MFSSANWFLVLVLYGSPASNVPTQPVGPFFSQIACDRAFTEIVKDYDQKRIFLRGYVCVPVPTEGD
jgi:hypothetical protein